MPVKTLRRATCSGSAAMLTLALTLTACSSGDQLDAGEVTTSTTSVEGRTVEIVVPSGTLTLVLSEPAEEIAGFSAPDGGSLIAVSTDYTQGEVRDDVFRFAGRADALLPADVTISIGDSDYSVGSVRSAQAGTDPLLRQFVLGVAQSPDAAQASVEVTYDGLTQVVDADGNREPGPADALYEEPAPAASRDCEDVTLTRGVDPSVIECRVDRVDRVPYLPGPGWAGEGRSWLAASVAVGVDPFDLDGDTYALGSVDDSSRVGGQETVAMLDDAEPVVASGWTGTLVFDTALDDPPSDIDLDMALGLTRTDGQLAEQSPDPLELRARAPIIDAP